MEIKFSGTPFILIGSQTYRCHQGKDINVSKKRFFTMKQKKKVLFEHSHIKSLKLPQPTKKMECLVTFQTKKIISFPEFSIKTNTKWNKTESSKKLKEYLNGLINLQFKTESGDNEF